ncbi:hypothetical protein BDZ45DRAFT_751462 [Acephala macrosclerotiorum]|nr:hypothetical protein BDZ45DRAFT_751462 [Acephala macrosclerotiorum]
MRFPSSIVLPSLTRDLASRLSLLASRLPPLASTTGPGYIIGMKEQDNQDQGFGSAPPAGFGSGGLGASAEYMMGFQEQGLAAQSFGSGQPATGPGSISHMMGLQALDTLTDSYGSGGPPPGVRSGAVGYMMSMQDQNGMALAQSFDSGTPGSLAQTESPPVLPTLMERIVQLNRESFTRKFNHGQQISADGTPSQSLDSLAHQGQNSNDNSSRQQQHMPTPRQVAGMNVPRTFESSSSLPRELDARGDYTMADTSAPGAQAERYVEAPNPRDITAMKRSRGSSSYASATPDAEGDVPMSMTDAPAPRRYHRAPGQLHSSPPESQLLNAQANSSQKRKYQSPYHTQGQWPGSPVESQFPKGAGLGLSNVQSSPQLGSSLREPGQLHSSPPEIKLARARGQPFGQSGPPQMGSVGSPSQTEHRQLMVPPSPLGFPPIGDNFPQPPNARESTQEPQSHGQMQNTAQGAPPGFERQDSHHQRGVREMSPALGSQNFESRPPAPLHPAIRRLSSAGQAKPPIPAQGLGLNMDSLSSGPRGLPRGGENNISRYNEPGLRMPSQDPSSDQRQMRPDAQGYRSSQPNPTRGDLSLLSARVNNLSARIDAGLQANPQAYLPGYVPQSFNTSKYDPSLFLPGNRPGRTFASQLQHSPGMMNQASSSFSQVQNSSGVMDQMEQVQTSRSFSPTMVDPQLLQSPMANPGSFSPSLSNYQPSSHPIGGANPSEALTRNTYLRIPEQRSMNQTHPSMRNPGTFSSNISNDQSSANSSTREKQSKTFERYPSLQMPPSQPSMNQMSRAQASMGNPGSFLGGAPDMQPSLNPPSGTSQSSKSFGPSAMDNAQRPTSQPSYAQQSRARAGSPSYGMQPADPSMNPMYKERPFTLNAQSLVDEEPAREKVSLKRRRAQATAERSAVRKSSSMSSTPLNMNSMTQGQVSQRNNGGFPADMSSPQLSMYSMQGTQSSGFASPNLDFLGNLPPAAPIKKCPPKATIEALMASADAGSTVPGASTSPLMSPQFYPTGELDQSLIQSGFGMLDPARITTGLPQHEIDRAIPSIRAQVSINRGKTSFNPEILKRARQGIIPQDLASLSTPDLQKLAAKVEAEAKTEGREFAPNPSTEYLLRMVQAVEQYRTEISSAPIQNIPLDTASNPPTEQVDPVANFYNNVQTDSNGPRGIGLRLNQIENAANAPHPLNPLLARRRKARREPLSRVLELTGSVIDNLQIDLQDASKNRAQQDQVAKNERESAAAMADKLKEEQKIKEFADKYLCEPDGSAMNWEVGLGMDIPNPPGFKPITEPMPLHEKKKDRFDRAKDFEDEITNNLGRQTALVNSMNAYQEGIQSEAAQQPPVAHSDGEGN